MAAAERLTEEALAEGLTTLPSWRLASGAEAGQADAIHREVRLAGFREAMALAGRVAELAEEADHHPDIAISFNRLNLRLTTHDAGGLTKRDLDLARRIESLLDGPATPHRGTAAYRRAPGSPAGRWVAESQEIQGVGTEGATLEAALEGLRDAVATRTGHTPALSLSLPGPFAMEPGTVAGQIRFQGSTLTLAWILRALAEAGSVDAFLEDHPIVRGADLAAALRLAADLAEGPRV